jgi:16S rRNA (guanine527-N7)-methyltransferase
MERMDTATIASLLEPYARLDERQLRATSIYIDLLLKWNARVNLTAVRGPQEIVTRHFGESFFVAKILGAQGSPSSVIDLGSGAGFPGIPLAMLMPAAQVTLIESNQKKSTFLKEVVFALGLKNVSVFTGRGESYSRKASLVTMRAVERFDKALPTAVGLLEPAGRIALMIGAGQADTARTLARKVEWNEPISLPRGDTRILMWGHEGAKVG